MIKIRGGQPNLGQLTTLMLVVIIDFIIIISSSGNISSVIGYISCLNDRKTNTLPWTLGLKAEAQFSCILVLQWQ